MSKKKFSFSQGAKAGLAVFLGSLFWGTAYSQVGIESKQEVRQMQVTSQEPSETQASSQFTTIEIPQKQEANLTLEALTPKLVQYLQSAYMRTAPVINFSIYNLQADKLEDFAEVATYNISTSVYEQPGVLSMLALNAQEQPNLVYMLELYREQEALREQQASPEHQLFTQSVQEGEQAPLTQVALEPEFIWDQEFVQTLENQALIYNFVVKQEQGDQFKQQLTSYLESLRNEAKDLLVIYAAKDQDHPQNWYLFLVFKDQSGYLAYQQSQLAAEFKQQVQTLLTRNHLIVVQPIFMMTAGVMDQPYIQALPKVQ
ncbi:antibiotic biosynthesis monooxygenase [Psittacicella gerlachiana]|uniref:antibiotic biosynthesis monooxygenase n=1 Tax=Psittacicella gerlachiana TaxID=2028574 RepID=UPI0011C35434|nr:antibiotic biosynthesis monooxygenase [Psittacicella gerlachiana]